MIEVSHLTKSFNDTRVLTDISAEFEEGKINFIIGKSGSGKTVLLKSIVGLHEIDSGKIFFHDREFTTMNAKQK
ncbi:MAG: ATP-binding cassette domain-containing protein, partial [Bacteroidales bacterium]|nr:ATP-binding cassette domain-containing protein [Bacteroidales bacterium]